MRSIVRVPAIALLLLVGAVLFQAGAARAQAPPEPKNLKVLPKDMPRREVVEIMRSFSRALGMDCSGCHAAVKPGAGAPGELDFASDEKPEKETARKMIRLADGVNEQIGKMGLKDPTEVRCITCHRGLQDPRTLAAVVSGTVEKNGVDAAIAKYRDLRTRYYGSGSYDFTPATLNQVALDLAGSKQDYASATKLLQLNLEYAPNDATIYATLGQVQLGKGDKGAAIQSFEKALQIDPNNRWAKRGLEQAKGGQ